MGTRMCHSWWGVAARLLPWALRTCERAQFLLLELAEASSELPFSRTFLFRHSWVQTMVGYEEKQYKVKKSFAVSSEWSTVPMTKTHMKLQGQHLPAEFKGWAGCWASGCALRLGWARLQL